MSDIDNIQETLLIFSEHFTELYTCLPSLTLGPLWYTSFETMYSW